MSPGNTPHLLGLMVLTAPVFVAKVQLWLRGPCTTHMKCSLLSLKQHRFRFQGRSTSSVTLEVLGRKKEMKIKEGGDTQQN